MSSTCEGPRKLLMSRPNIVSSIIKHLSHPSPNIRVAATWCIINWTWITCEKDEEALAERVRHLRVLGVEEKLQAMVKDSSLDVCERAKTALDQMTSLAA
ncbi:hypothetical protein BX666DRAFT_1006713 [Dichotomocladium elegans]|nr:hypothetical protein BX666DRAFT_1006713 [Dichotomocladium elegans]